MVSYYDKKDQTEIEEIAAGMVAQAQKKGGVVICTLGAFPLLVYKSTTVEELVEFYRAMTTVIPG